MNINEKIADIGRSDIIVHAGLTAFRNNRCTYTEALEMMVIELSAIRVQQQATLIEIASRSSVPGVLCR